MKIIKLLILSIFLLTFGYLKAQTNPTSQSIPYSQNFSSLASSSTTYPAGWQGWQLSSSGPSTTFRTTIPTGDISLVASGTASSTTGAVYNYNGKIGVLLSGSLDASICLSISTTGYAGIVVSYDAMTIRNPYDGTSNTRINEMTLQYRVGTSGSFTSLTGIEYQNNTTSQTTAVTTPQNTIFKSITLPNTCDNQSTVQLRWVQRGVSGTGSRPSFAIDNISISSGITRSNNITGLVVNEFSQGESGNRDYVELVVSGPPCSRVDLRGWIIDDNNGVFSGGPVSGVGIAPGYIRFSNNIYWSSISTGTIILIYNSDDISSSISILSKTDQTTNPIVFPLPNVSSTSTDSTYFVGNKISPNASDPSALYSSSRTFPAWDQISLKQDFDGFQTRKPDTTFFHGAAFGSLETTHPDYSTYNPNHLLFGTLSPTNGDDRNYYLSDTLYKYDFRDRTNWTTDIGSTTRTPGSPNNAKNNAWINYMIGGCPLPIELYKFTSTCNGDNTSIYFSTLSQTNVDYFYLQKSTDGINWADFAWFQGKKYSSQLDEFRATDDSKYKYYYRIKEVDLDGTIIYSKMIYSSCLNTDNNNTIDIKIINNNILNIQTNSNEKLILSLYSIDGKLIKSDIIKNTSQISLDALSRGIYVTSLISESGQINIVKKILIK